MRSCRNRASFSGGSLTRVLESGFLDWAFMIARYEVLKYRRRRATDRLRFSEDVFQLLATTAESVTATQDQRLRLLRECVAKLESAQLELVKAIYEDGAAINDVANQIGRSPTGLYKTLARIRNRIASCVQAKLGSAAAEGTDFSAEQRDLELVNGYCSGCLTDAEFLELEDRLRESGDLRQLLVEYRAVETALPTALPS